MSCIPFPPGNSARPPTPSPSRPSKPLPLLSPNLLLLRSRPPNGWGRLSLQAHSFQLPKEPSACRPPPAPGACPPSGCRGPRLLRPDRYGHSSAPSTAPTPAPSRLLSTEARPSPQTRRAGPAQCSVCAARSQAARRWESLGNCTAPSRGRGAQSWGAGVSPREEPSPQLGPALYPPHSVPRDAGIMGPPPGGILKPGQSTVFKRRDQEPSRDLLVIGRRSTAEPRRPGLGELLNPRGNHVGSRLPGSGHRCHPAAPGAPSGRAL